MTPASGSDTVTGGGAESDPQQCLIAGVDAAEGEAVDGRRHLGVERHWEAADDGIAGLLAYRGFRGC
jgi:hypothetical protein